MLNQASQVTGRFLLVAAQHQPIGFPYVTHSGGARAFVLLKCHSAFPGSVSEGYRAVRHYDLESPRVIGMRQEPRLRLPKERAAPELGKAHPQGQTGRRTRQKKARAKIPKERRSANRGNGSLDPCHQRTVTRLRFEEVDKEKPASKLSHAIQDAPERQFSPKYKEIRESEESNVGVEKAP